MKQIAFLEYIATILLLIGSAGMSKAQVTDNVDPTVEQFPIIKGVGDPDYTGSANVSIPVMTVPGIQGLDYNVTLQYVCGNGVPISSSASWVGLGWNLDNYEITCNPVNGNPSGGSIYYYYQRTSDEYVPDLYYLSYPGGSTPFWLDSNGKGIPVKWSAIKIIGIRDGALRNYKCFIVYGLDGTKYIFADRLRKEAGGTMLLNHDPVWPSHDPSYYYVFKLSAILAPDYIDGGGPAWYLPNDGGTDVGAWIRFSYSTPESYPAVTANGYVTNYQEVSYLSTVTTPTHTASFVLSSETRNPFIINSLLAGAPSYLHSLERIILRRTGQQNSIRTAEFIQSNGFDWLMNAGDGNYDWYYQNQRMEYNLRMRLDGLRIWGAGDAMSEPSYRFYYNYDALDFSTAPSNYCIDNWGYLAANSDIGKSFPEHCFFYGILNKVVYPTGGFVEFSYEPNYFQPEKNSPRTGSGLAVKAGGLRLKEQSVTDPQMGQEHTYRYEYGKTNNYMTNKYSSAGLPYPGVGFVSSDPGATQSVVSTICSLGANIRQEVHYPDIVTTRPDGSMIKKYFTAACTEMAFPGSNDYSWMFKDGNQEQRLAFHKTISWPHFDQPQAGMHSIPYAKCDIPGTGQTWHSLQSNDFPFAYYPLAYPLGFFNTTTPYDVTTLDVNGIASCELVELDDCNSNFIAALSAYGTQWSMSGFIKTVGIDNSWKRGYPVKEEKYASGGTLVWSKEYYYDMLLKFTQDFTIAFPVTSSSGRVHFTECSGEVRLIKTVEKKY